ncbi:hypothetical protein [Gymnodinialimonas ulvae]|uniref:hypothetical protein n=1 Tax=Gymnodinialimonas ulvae TaxID=3126504 RepID=UPI0030AAB334
MFEINLDRPPIEALLYEAGPNTDAVLAHHAAPRDWRAAWVHLGHMIRPAFTVPLVALALGLFLFWFPFRRKARDTPGPKP